MTQLTPYLSVRDARAAMDWYCQALGARVVGDPYVMDDDRIGHAAVEIGGAVLYLADEHPELGLTAPQEGATSVSPDGTSSAAAVNATTITVNPPVIADLLAGGQDFVKLELVTANAAVGSQIVPLAVQPAATPVSLPRTGGSAITAAAASLLIGAALVARRRRATV